MEIGKKYVFRTNIEVYTCICIAGDGRPVLESPSYNVFKCYDENGYKEYKEPKTGTTRILIRQDLRDEQIGVIIDGTYESPNWKTIAVVTVPWVEGQGI